MKLINFEYYFERIELRYSDVKIDNVIKILVRAKKMYDTID